jgi:tryptophanyl-tRNA synthetase
MAQTGSASVGLFTYPVLMAADIMIYQAAQVPVGEDQRQHLELTRELARRFNTRFGPTFRVPEPYMLRDTAKIYDLQEPTAKMSKSAASQAGVLDVLEDPAAVRKKIMRAVTDTGTEVRADPDHKPGVTNLLAISSALSGEPVPAIEARYAGQGYGAFKKDVAEQVTEFVAPIQARVAELLADEAGLDRILAAGADKARALAAPTLERAYDRIGFLPAGRR